jgi:very-short-patch-repair endonuclease
MAAVLAGGPGAVLSHEAGAALLADCLWRSQGLIVELAGRATHATSAAFEHDRARDRILQAAEWRVIRVTWRQLHEEPAALAEDLRTLTLLRP